LVLVQVLCDPAKQAQSTRTLLQALVNSAQEKLLAEAALVGEVRCVRRLQHATTACACSAS